MNTNNAEQIYSNYDNTLVSVLPTQTNRIIHQTSNEGSNGTDYSNIYLPNIPVTIINTGTELHHHHASHQYISNKKCDSGFIESKESHMIHIYHEDGSNIMQSADLPVLTPLKYMDYHPNNLSNIVTTAEEQILMANDDALSEKSDCESLNNELNKLPMKNTKRSLPHKKRIAKKLNSDEFSIILSADDSNMRALQTTTPHFECIECGLSFIGQLEFYVHLKEHYEGQSCQTSMLRTSTKRKHEELEIHQEDDPNSVPENLIIESLEDSQDDIKSEGMEADAFGFSEPEDMEDFRKEVEKVVETIGDTECLPDESWNYQVTDEIGESSTNDVGMIDNFNEKMDNGTMEQSVFSSQSQEECESYLCTQEVVKNEDHTEKLHQTILQNLASNPQSIVSNNVINNEMETVTDEEDDNKTLEQVRIMLKKTKKHQIKKLQNDEELINECLKKIQTFKCNDCLKCFNSRTALGYHLKTHSSERRYVCDQCGKKFLTNGALKVHLRLHTDDRPYKCNFPECGKSFRQWGDLKYHETSLHSGKKDHICEFCAKCFARKYSLVIHRRIHTGEKTYKCTECDKSFRASSYLLNHKRIHSGERPFACTVCGKKFRVQGDLKRHTKIHDRVKNGVVKDSKKKQPVVETAPAVTDFIVKNECVDLTTEKKLIESNDSSNLIENLTKKGIDNNEVSKKVKKSHSKKKGSKP